MKTLAAMSAMLACLSPAMAQGTQSFVDAFWGSYGVYQHTDAEWAKLVDHAFRTSRMQNRGKADVRRSCQPDISLCTMAIYFMCGEKAKEMCILRTAENVDGRVINRDLCGFNSFMDVRTCVNFDTNVVTREMKDSQGNWGFVDR